MCQLSNVTIADDLSYAGKSFEEICSLAAQAEMSVEQYLDDVAERREQILQERSFIGDCGDDGECD
jgi:hypothetical protein